MLRRAPHILFTACWSNSRAALGVDFSSFYLFNKKNKIKKKNRNLTNFIDQGLFTGLSEYSCVVPSKAAQNVTNSVGTEGCKGMSSWKEIGFPQPHGLHLICAIGQQLEWLSVVKLNCGQCRHLVQIKKD